MIPSLLVLQWGLSVQDAYPELYKPTYIDAFYFIDAVPELSTCSKRIGYV